MAQLHHPLSWMPVVEKLFQFLDPLQEDRVLFRLGSTCTDCYLAVTLLARKMLLQAFLKGNEQVAFPLPLDDGASDTEIEIREKELGVGRFPFYLREFLKLNRGRWSWNEKLIHPTNVVCPMEEWEPLHSSTYIMFSRHALNSYFTTKKTKSLILIGCLYKKRACVLYEPICGGLFCLYQNRIKKLRSILHWYSEPVDQTFNFDFVPFTKITTKEEAIANIQNHTRVSVYPFLTKQLREDIDVVLAATQHRYESAIPLKYKDDPQFMLEYVCRNTFAFFLCSPRLRYDFEFVKTCVKKNVFIVMLRVSDKWRYDISFKLRNFLKSEMIEFFKHVNINFPKLRALPRLRNGPLYEQDRGTVISPSSALRVVQENGLFLQYCSEEARSDRNIVKQAIQENGMALQFASEELRNDLELVRIALLNNPEIYSHLSQTVQEDSSIALTLVSNFTDQMHRIPECLKINTDFLSKAIDANPNNIWSCTSAFQFVMNDCKRNYLKYLLMPEMPLYVLVLKIPRTDWGNFEVVASLSLMLKNFNEIRMTKKKNPTVSSVRCEQVVMRMLRDPTKIMNVREAIFQNTYGI
ncbi:hypothetical protein C9374_011812 [Naegleria lovaniensis]|uniref:DUF4116 domain-containing protein n=1 Tax=Naegleria lovaniensis TaxID=51637 RepID=A0AA88GF49_NAELO|nr:uncharacterized protein C9374_011812 [Naegleria lovaniensis]KAG2373723.1 hypothetical protein C9374_011812 [Naegleria lovaniensis]